ncbi:hypothetical protein PENTCL1PPCAC_26593, partial [Pristionchus entomophagus]
ISHLMVILLSSTVYSAIHEEGYVTPNEEDNYGPVIRTGRYRVIQERIIGSENGYASTHLDRPFIQGRQEIPQGGEHFQYNGPMDGRKIYIYKRVHTPVRVNNGVIERLGPGETMERWAEGGYKNGHGHDLHVYSRQGHDVYSEDKVVPVKEGFMDGMESL